jgi:lipid-A-disaccharide synthase-like uncharacterized protein
MKEPFMLLLGYSAQVLFAGRFAIQWLVSERKGRSVIPLAFWLLSLAGGLLMLGYALLRRDQVFIVGQAAGLAVYLRNLFLIRREALRDAREIGA